MFRENWYLFPKHMPKDQGKQGIYYQRASSSVHQILSKKE